MAAIPPTTRPTAAALNATSSTRRTDSEPAAIARDDDHHRARPGSRRRRGWRRRRRQTAKSAATIVPRTRSRARSASAAPARARGSGVALGWSRWFSIQAIVRSGPAGRKKLESAALALLDRAIVRVLPAVPRRVVRRLSDRYIAGPELADAVATVRALNDNGQEGDARRPRRGGRRPPTRRVAIRAEYEQAMRRSRSEGLDANVSVKLTGLGLKVDPELCAESVRALARIAAGHGRFVRIDMEDSSTTTATLDLYRRLRAEGHDNVGIVLQAMLRRTLDDVAELAGLEAERARLQGHLRRAGRDRLPGRRGDPVQLRRDDRGALGERRQGGRGDARRRARRQGARPDPRRAASGPSATSSSSCSASARSWPTSSSAAATRCGSTFPYGQEVVRVLAPPPAGEPEARRLRRPRHRSRSLRP